LHGHRLHVERKVEHLRERCPIEIALLPTAKAQARGVKGQLFYVDLKKLNGRWLVDGGLVNPCPTSLARSYGGHVVIAVSLHTDVIGEPDERASSDETPLLAAMNADAKTNASSWIRPDRLILQHIFGPGRDGPGLSTVMLNALNILLDRVSRARLAGDPPDVLIAPHVAQIGLIEFDRAAETIELGAKAARDALPYIQHALHKLS